MAKQVARKKVTLGKKKTGRAKKHPNKSDTTKKYNRQGQ